MVSRFMSLREPVRKILDIICELSKMDSNSDVIDQKIYERASPLPKDEVDNCLRELRSLELIDRVFFFYFITQKGIAQCSKSEDQKLR